MLCKAKFDVYSKIQKNTQIPCDHNIEYLNVRPCGK